MISVSGKFASPVSNYTGDDTKIPPVPTTVATKTDDNGIVGFLTEYFGKFWWLWLVLILFINVKKQ